MSTIHTQPDARAFHPDDFSDEADAIRAWHESVVPMSGTCFCSNEAFHAGRVQVERMAAHYERTDRALELSGIQAANLLYYVRSVMHPDGWRDNEAGTALCGQCILLEAAERTLRSLAERVPS